MIEYGMKNVEAKATRLKIIQSQSDSKKFPTVINSSKSVKQFLTVPDSSRQVMNTDEYFIHYQLIMV